MTLEEKLGQLQQLDGEVDGHFRPEHLELAPTGPPGLDLNVRGAARVNELQKAAVEGSRLKIPLLFGYDTIHGYRTIFPIPLGEAAELRPGAGGGHRPGGSRRVGRGRPQVDVRARWWTSRATRAGAASPRARARTRTWAACWPAHACAGFQGDDYSRSPIGSSRRPNTGSPTAPPRPGRDYNTTESPERALREIYFPPFQAALDAGVGTLMSAFNDVDGDPGHRPTRFTLTQGPAR